MQVITNAVREYDNVNFFVSPISVWSMMVQVAEGADGATFAQMKHVLNLPHDLTHIRSLCKHLRQVLTVNTSTIELASSRMIYTDVNLPISADYVYLLDSEYDADYISVDFFNANNTARLMNERVRQETRGKIREIYKDDDLKEAKLLLMSALYFKGKWKVCDDLSETLNGTNRNCSHFQLPFNATLTSQQPFYDETGRLKSFVSMMRQSGSFSIASISALNAIVLELPYGNEDRLSMLILLPRSYPLASVFDRLADFSIETILNELHKYDEVDSPDENEVELILPRFTINSDLNVVTVLETMGINDVFSASRASLTKISRAPISLSKVIHRTVIDVTEEGRFTHTAADSRIMFLTGTPQIVVNHPFGFLIVEKTTSTLLFGGQVRDPNEL